MYIYLHNLLLFTTGKLLWVCKESAISIFLKSGEILTQSALLPIPEEDVIDTSSSVNTIKSFFTNDTWMAIEQKCKELGEILISYLQ